MQILMVMFTFFVLDRKHSFWANLVPTFIIVCLKRNFVSRLFQIYRFDGDIHFSARITLFEQTWLKKLKFSVYAEI